MIGLAGRDRPELLGSVPVEDAGGLRFKTQDDAVNYGHQLAKGARDWEARHLPSVSEHYVKGNCELVVDMTIRGRRSDYQLIIVNVPDGWDSDTGMGAVNAVPGIFDDLPAYLARELVFVWPGGTAKGKELDTPDKCLIEGMPQIADSSRSDVASPSGDLPIEFDLERLVAGLRIDINDIGCAISLKEGLADCLELVEVFTSLSDEKFWAFEGHA
jgi:hypothetical protein